MLYPIHTLTSAPATSRPSLEALQSAFGFLPNLLGAMANSPVLIDSLVALFGKVHGGSFTEPQIQILLLTNAVTNQSDWAVAFHSALALEQGIAATEVAAIRAGGLPQDPVFAALSTLAKTLIDRRGKIDGAAAEAFLAAGFSEAELLEVIAVSAASTITNYTVNVTRPPLEERFSGQLWQAA